MPSLNIAVKQSEIRKLQRQLTGRGKEYEKAVKSEVHKAALNIESKAKQNATPVVDTGRLRASIVAEIDQTRPSANVHTNVFYAPYIEFGTGRFAASYLADKAKEIKAYAMEFYKNGKGRTMSHPFLLPAADAERPRLIKALRSIKP